MLCGGMAACHAVKFNKECICWCMNFIDFHFLRREMRHTG